MRKAMILSILLVLAPAGARGSLVIHSAEPGIVAVNGVDCLDSDGHVWAVTADGWIPTPQVDPPMPIGQIKYWEAQILVTVDDVLWRYWQDAWRNYGTWPSSATPEEEISTSPVSILSTPGPGPFRVAFALREGGPVSVTVYDATGRQVRELLSATLPAGEYAPAWDGLDGAGREAPSGVYLARILTPGGEESARIVLTR